MKTLLLLIALIFTSFLYAQPSNDCPTGAINLNTQVNSVDFANPFSCTGPSTTANATVTNVVGGGAIPCILTPGANSVDVWYRFTIGAATIPLFVSVYPWINGTPGGAADISAALYRGTLGGTCSAITGLTYVDCSDGVTIGGARDVGAGTTPVVPRFDLGGLPSGTYYLRVMMWNGAAFTAGLSFNVCLEKKGGNPTSYDRCPAAGATQIGCQDAVGANKSYTVTYQSQTNAGMLGNSGNDRLDEPPLIASLPGGAFEIQEGVCVSPAPAATGWVIPLGLIPLNNVMNNTVIYPFKIDAGGVCTGTYQIFLRNMTYDGFPGNAAQVTVLPPTASCATSLTAIAGLATAEECMGLRPLNGTGVPDGMYHLVVDGQDGQLVKFDLELTVQYSGPVCNPTPSECQTTLPVKLLSFTANKTVNDYVTLEWITSAESNNIIYTVQRSIDQRSWSNLGTMQSLGNGNENVTYRMTDYRPFTNRSYYRLQKKDVDGQISYSDIRFIDLNIISAKVKVLPTATSGQTSIIADKDELSSIKIYNVTGQDMTDKVVMVKGDNENTIQLNVARLASGLYFIKTKTSTTRLVRE